MCGGRFPRGLRRPSSVRGGEEGEDGAGRGATSSGGQREDGDAVARRPEARTQRQHESTQVTTRHATRHDMPRHNHLAIYQVHVINKCMLIAP